MGIFPKYLFAGLIWCMSGLNASETLADPGQAVPDRAPIVSDMGLAVSDEDLGGQTGRQDVAIGQVDMRTSDVKSDALMESSVLSSTNSTLNNGANTISQNSFANAGGLVTVIQNTGNQVLIQNDMVLNMFMK